jgi:pyroglutamyl-peptidase
VTTVVQGFGPFGQFERNPSQELVEALASRIASEGAVGVDDVVTVVLPVERAVVAREVPALVAEHRPSAWIGVGLAVGRPSLSIEAVALNLAQWSEPDRGGAIVEREPVVDGGADAYLTGLPVDEILASWQASGIPGYLSQTAGSYLCNMSFYLAARAADELALSTAVGFVHVPLLPEQVSEPSRQPSMARDLQARGLDSVIAATRSVSNSSRIYKRRSA